MILLHEPESPAFAERHPVEADAVASTGEDYEDGLIWLLSRLEHKRRGLESLRTSGRLSSMLEQATELVDLVIAFAEEHCAFSVGRDKDEATTRIRDFRSSQAAIRERLPIADSGSAQLDAGLQTLVKRCFASLQDAIVAYFTIFTSRFPTSRAALGWVEAAASFIVELKKLTKEPMFQHS